MADYIDRNILCQAYIHIEPLGLDEDEYSILQNQIAHFIETRGRFFLYSEITTDVELKAGSLKVYATIAGCLYLAIGQYGDFRSGLDYISTDVKRLSESIVNESLFLSKSRHENIIRVEARVGVIGSLKKAVDDIEYIEQQMGQSDSKALTKKLRNTRIEIEKLLENLNDDRDMVYVRNNLLIVVKETLPKNPKAPPGKSVDRETQAIYIDERRKLLEILERRGKESK